MFLFVRNAGITCLLIIVLPLAAAAQDSAYYIQHFNGDNGLPQNSVKWIEMDAKGYLWMATEDGLVRYDGAHFRLYDQLPENKRLNDRVVSVNRSETDSVYIRVAGKKYYRVNSAGLLEEFTLDKQYDWEDWLRSSDMPFKVYEMCRKNIEENKIPAWAMPSKRLIEHANNGNVVYINKHYVWFNDNTDIILGDMNAQNVRTLQLKGFEGFTQTDLNTFLLASNDSLFINWAGYMWETAIDTIQGYLYGKRLFKTAGISNITSFARNLNHQIAVVGSGTDGFYLYKKKPFTVERFDSTATNIFYALAPVGNSSILTDKGVLPDHTSPKFKNYRFPALLRKRNGEYIMNRWANQFESGLVLMDSNLHQLKYIRHNNLRVSSIAELSNGDIWLAGERLFLGRIEQDSIRWYRNMSVDSSYYINAFIEYGHQQLLVSGTFGLAIYNIATNQFKVFEELKDKQIRTMYRDNLGMIWLGSYGHGIYCFYNGIITTLPLDRNRYLTHAHAFMTDARGYCWISTNRGLFETTLAGMQQYVLGKTDKLWYFQYDKTSGFYTNEFNGGCTPSAIELANGYFAFPSMNGVVVFNPLTTTPSLPSNVISIDQVRCDSSFIALDGHAIRLPANSNELQFSISSPYYGNAYNNFIQYRLDGYEDNWQELPADGQLTFKHLSNGSYKLLLKKTAGFDNAEVLKELAFEIKAAYYETPAFKLLIGAVTIGLLWLLFRFKTRLVIRQKQLLEQEVANRTKEQKQLIEQLVTTVEQLEISRSEVFQYSVFLERLAMTISHDLQSPLRFFEDISGRLNQKIQEQNNLLLKDMSADLAKSSRALHIFVQELGWWIKSFGSSFKQVQNSIALKDLFEHMQVFFSELLKQKGNYITLHIPADLEIIADKQLLSIVIRNIIDNANKYSQQSEIAIQAYLTGDTVSISTSDHGRGIAPDKLHSLKRIVKNSFSSNHPSKESSGYGYYIIGDFCRLMNIAISIESENNIGTTVVLSELQVNKTVPSLS